MPSNENLTSIFTDTANAIRGKSGGSAKIKPVDFADQIINLPSGGGISIPPVTDITLDAVGMLHWVAGDYSALDEFKPVISYLISINDKPEMETSDVSFDGNLYLQAGTNSVKVTVKALLTNKDNTIADVIYSPKVETFIVTTIPTYQSGNDTEVWVAYKKKIYGFGSSSGDKKTILEFDTETGQTIKLSAQCPDTTYGRGCLVGDDIYIFGNKETYVYKFNCITKTTSLLTNVRIPVGVYNAKPILYENNIYFIAGEHGYNQPANYGKKYDLASNTFSTIMNMPLNEGRNNGSTVLYEHYIFVFGGENGNPSNKVQTDEIIKYDILNDTYKTLSVKLSAKIGRTVENVIFDKFAYMFPTSATNYKLVKFDLSTETEKEINIFTPNKTFNLRMAQIDGETKAYACNGYASTEEKDLAFYYLFSL